MIRRGWRGGLVWTVSCLGYLFMATSSHAQPGSNGFVVGTVTDAATGAPILDAGVEETKTGIWTATDKEGRYRLEFAPGAYHLRVVGPFYEAKEIDVTVTAGRETRVDVQLKAGAGGQIEQLDVVGQAYGGSEASQLLERKLAPTLSDNISAEMIKLSPDSDAAEIVQRVPAVTIQDDKFLNVRGLNERYTSALLNINRLPSTDPQRRAVPLDLFPASFIESISIVKTYTPDLPGDFSGGLADIRLTSYPDELTASVGMSTGINSQTTFQDFSTYKGAGGPDYFGYGEAFRGLPGLIPEKNIQQPSPSKQREYAASFRNIWQTDDVTAPPNYNFGASVGGMLLDNLGGAIGLTFRNEWKYRDDEIAREYGGEKDDLRVLDDFVYARSTFETTLGIVATSGYEIADGHDLTFRGLYNRDSEDEVLQGNGSIDNVAEPLKTRYLQYTSDELGWGQLAGMHRFDWLDVDWRSALARTAQDQPDGRFDTRTVQEDGSELWSPVRFGGRRAFGDLREVLTDTAVDFTVPFKTWLPLTDLWSGLDASFKFGPAYMFRKREHNLRQFTWSSPGPLVDLSLPTEQLLIPQNVLPGGFTFAEVTLPRDSFEGKHEIAGFYGMFDLPILGGWADDEGMLWHQLRLIAGVRTEYSYIVTDTVDDSGQPVQPILNDLDPLPGINLVYSPIEDVNLRFAWSRAVSRPELRELSPVQYPSPGGLRPLAGNPDLVSASIESFDLRAEWFLTGSEVVSVGFFYKDLSDPIEAIVIAQGNNFVDSFVNADSATVLGVEMESRLGLHHLTEYLQNFSLSTNVTWADSEAKISNAGAATTSSERELQGQAPFIVNLSLDYTHEDWGTARFLYNTIGERLTSVGQTPLPDIFEERRDQLDFVYLTEIEPFDTPLSAKFAVENLLNDDYTYVQGGEVQRKWATGVKFSFGLSYSY
jgi:hypothetical protein